MGVVVVSTRRAWRWRKAEGVLVFQPTVAMPAPSMPIAGVSMRTSVGPGASAARISTSYSTLPSVSMRRTTTRPWPPEPIAMTSWPAGFTAASGS